jgi:hypothetical protein
MVKKLTKTDYVNEINSHFALKGKKLTNLSKATLPRLKEIVEKYNIEIDETEINEKKEEERKEIEERAKEWAEERAKREKTTERRKKEWNELTEDQQDDVLCFIVLKEQKAWGKNYWKHKEHNRGVVRSTDAMEALMRGRGDRVERTSLNTLNANGVEVINNHIYEPFNWDNSYSQLKKFLDFGIIRPLTMLKWVRLKREGKKNDDTESSSSPTSD